MGEHTSLVRVIPQPTLLHPQIILLQRSTLQPSCIIRGLVLAGLCRGLGCEPSHVRDRRRRLRAQPTILRYRRPTNLQVVRALVQMSSGIPGIHSLRPPRSGTEQRCVVRSQRARQDIRAELHGRPAHRHLDASVLKEIRFSLVTLNFNAWRCLAGVCDGVVLTSRGRDFFQGQDTLFSPAGNCSAKVKCGGHADKGGEDFGRWTTTSIPKTQQQRELTGESKGKLHIRIRGEVKEAHPAASDKNTVGSCDRAPACLSESRRSFLFYSPASGLDDQRIKE